MAAHVRTNEVPGTRAVARYTRVSAFKVRPVLDLIRGHDVETAREILALTERGPAEVVQKVLGSAVANARHNDEQIAEELYVSACFADEGPTLRRFRPRARGRATRIRKRSCHVTVIVSRFTEEEIERRRQEDSGRSGTRAARRAAQQEAEARRAAAASDEVDEVEAPEAAVELDEVEAPEAAVEADEPQAAAEADAPADDSTEDDSTADDSTEDDSKDKD